MLNGALTKEEVQGLLADIAGDGMDEQASRTPDRIGDRSELAIQYLQQTVMEVQRELGELRERVALLERQGHGQAAEEGFRNVKTPAAVKPGSDPKPNVTLSRAEKHRSQRGKWF